MVGFFKTVFAEANSAKASELKISFFQFQRIALDQITWQPMVANL